MSECKHEWEPAWIEYEDDVCRICECSKKYWKVQTRIAKLKAEIAELREAAKIVIDEHTSLVEINATGGSEAIDGLAEALRESGDE